MPSGQAEILNPDISTVSREAAQSYEEYEKWYKNRAGLFTDLGKYIGDEYGSASAFSRVEIAGQTVKLRSSVEGLRNPVHRVVEFYTNTILSGSLGEAMTLRTESGTPALKEAIITIWERSNMAATKQVAKRYLSRDGQLFMKVVSPEGKDYCYIQMLPPKHITDYDIDERGNVTYIRTDVPGVEEDVNGRSVSVWNTEIWRKGAGADNAGFALFATSRRTVQYTVPSEKYIASVGQRVPLGVGDLPDARLPDGQGQGPSGGYPFDFVPFVVVNAVDTGEKRPPPVYAHGLQLISWICREASRLSDLMFRFNKAFKVIGGMGNDSTGRPLPPPKPGGFRDLGAIRNEQYSNHTVPFGGTRGHMLSRDQEDITVEGIAVVGLPGNAVMMDATPNINYEAARLWIADHIQELYQELPELLYYAIEPKANQSGIALRTLIAGALNRAQEMQANLILGIVKVNKMALTISQYMGSEGFSEADIGTYEAGSFDHTIEGSEILAVTEQEAEQVVTTRLANAQNLTQLLAQLGMPLDQVRRIVLAELGYEDLSNEADDIPNEEIMPNTSLLKGVKSKIAAQLRENETGPLPQTNPSAAMPTGQAGSARG